MGPDFSNRVLAAVNSIRARTTLQPDVALVTGTGLAGLVDQIDVQTIISFSQIAGFPRSTAPSHKGELIFGTIGATPVVAQSGRFHLYEGWGPQDIVLPVYVLAALGAQNYVVTNAAGALNKDFSVADIMLIEDHLNFQGLHALAGPNDENLGPRFPDMSRAYDPDLRYAALDAAAATNNDLRRGIYAAVHGPEFETSAERRFLIMAGGDAVGMSTVPEVIAANHAGLKVLGFSAITNAATGADDQQPDRIEEVVENANLAAKKIQSIILHMFTAGDFRREKI